MHMVAHKGVDVSLRMKLSFLFLFLLASSLNFRLRASGADLHVGGGELAISPYDFVLVASFFLLPVWRGVKFDLLCIPILATFIFSLLSVVFAIRVEYVFYELFRGLKFFLVFLFLRSLFADSRVVASLPYFVSFIVFMEFFYCLYQYLFLAGSETEDATGVKNLFLENGVLRVAGTLRHPALLSFYVVLLIPLLVAGGVLRSRLYYFAAVLLAFVCIGFTFSRTQYLLGFLSVVLCFFYFSRDSGARLIMAKAPFFVLMLGVSFLIVLISINYQVLLDRFLNAPESSFTTRLLLAEIAFNMILDSPLIGVGLNNFVYAMPAYDSFGVHHYFPHPVHNMYLLIASEIGLLGLLSFALFFVLFFVRVFRGLRGLSVFEANIVKGALISFFMLFLTGVQGWSFRADSIQLLLVMYASLALAVRDSRIRGEI